MSELIPWRTLAVALPEFVQSYIARYGPIADDDPGVDQTRYEALVAEMTLD